jgi:hypothetical protein
MLGRLLAQLATLELKALRESKEKLDLLALRA